MSILLDDKEIIAEAESQPMWRDGDIIWTNRAQVIAKATAKKIALKLQAIYNLPEGGMFHKKMGEFIQELMEEVG